MENSRNFDPFSLVLGILSVILAFFVLKHPGFSLVAVIFTIGIFMLADGVLHFFGRNKLRDFGMRSTGFITFAAILDIVVGILMIAMPKTFGMAYVWIVVAIGLLVDSLFELWAAKFIRLAGKGYYWFTVITAVLGVVLAVIMLFSPTLAITFVLSLLAFYLLVFGIMQIVKSF